MTTTKNLPPFKVGDKVKLAKGRTNVGRVGIVLGVYGRPNVIGSAGEWLIQVDSDGETINRYSWNWVRA